MATRQWLFDGLSLNFASHLFFHMNNSFLKLSMWCQELPKVVPLHVLDYFKNSFVKKIWGQHQDVRVEEENISIFVDKLTAILFWVYFKEM